MRRVSDEAMRPPRALPSVARADAVARREHASLNSAARSAPPIPTAAPVVLPPLESGRAAGIFLSPIRQPPLVCRATLTRRLHRHHGRRRCPLALQARGPARRIEHIEQAFVHDLRATVGR